MQARTLFFRRDKMIPFSQAVLSNALPGSEVMIRSTAGLGKIEEKSLQAYGILPGRRVKILAQTPVTILQVEQTELALEFDVANKITIE